MSNNPEDSWLTPAEARAKIKVGRGKLYQLIKSGQLPASMVGSRYRVHVNDLAAYMAGNRVEKQEDSGPV